MYNYTINTIRKGEWCMWKYIGIPIGVYLLFNLFLLFGFYFIPSFTSEGYDVLSFTMAFGQVFAIPVFIIAVLVSTICFMLNKQKRKNVN